MRKTVPDMLPPVADTIILGVVMAIFTAHASKAGMFFLPIISCSRLSRYSAAETGSASRAGGLRLSIIRLSIPGKSFSMAGGFFFSRMKEKPRMAGDWPWGESFF